MCNEDKEVAKLAETTQKAADDNKNNNPQLEEGQILDSEGTVITTDEKTPDRLNG